MESKYTVVKVWVKNTAGNMLEYILIIENANISNLSTLDLVQKWALTYNLKIITFNQVSDNAIML